MSCSGSLHFVAACLAAHAAARCTLHICSTIDCKIHLSAGVALDDLVYICTKIARQMDANGLSKVFDAADTATAAIEEARPLLDNAVKLVDEVSLCTPVQCLNQDLTINTATTAAHGNAPLSMLKLMPHNQCYNQGLILNA